MWLIQVVAFLAIPILVLALLAHFVTEALRLRAGG